MNSPAKITKLLKIHGRVQGVYFRESMCQKAAQLGITGWVRNLRDGTVEATVQGSGEAVEKITEWARSGPPAAHVSQLEISDGSGDYSEFRRLQSA